MSPFPHAVLIRRVLVLLATFALLPASAAQADNWVKVADKGLGELTPASPLRSTTTAMTSDGTSVYVASHSTTSTGAVQPWVFRYRAGRWANITPNWGAAGKVSDMVVFRGSLLVATETAGIWALTRDNLREYWRRAVSIGSPIRAMAVSGGAVCAAHGILTVSCSADPLVYAFQARPAHPRATDGTIGSARLAEHRGELYLGFGGSAAGSRRCELWKLSGGTRWDAVSTTCFGRAGQTWVLSMRTFGSWLYIGTGGHDGARLWRWDSGASYAAMGDVTPYALYPAYSSGYGEVPVRYQAMTTTSTHLFVGTRTSAPPMGGDVISRDASGTWVRSNMPGFGETNDQVSALTTLGSTVYAATINGNGFQVWQRML